MVGRVDAVIVLLVVSLLALASGGVYQQRFCRSVDFRATAALQNTASLIPVAVLAAVMPWTVTNLHTAVVAVGAVVLLNATLCMTMYVRALARYGAAAVAMLFAVIPAIAGVLSWLLLGQRPDLGVVVGLVLGALACWLNSRAVARTVRPASPAPATRPLQTAESSRSGPSDRRDPAAECPCP
jgi:drug/metabolite transporter (DMT)-like permease